MADNGHFKARGKIARLDQITLPGITETDIGLEFTEKERDIRRVIYQASTGLRIGDYILARGDRTVSVGRNILGYAQRIDRLNKRGNQILETYELRL